MEMPIRTFWCYFGRIHSLAAEEKLDAIDAAMCGMSGEYAKIIRAQLMERIGTPIVEDPVTAAELKAPETHSAGLARLRALGGRSF